MRTRLCACTLDLLLATAVAAIKATISGDDRMESGQTCAFEARFRTRSRFLRAELVSGSLRGDSMSVSMAVGRFFDTLTLTIVNGL
jgi:hypothetical protein